MYDTVCNQCRPARKYKKTKQELKVLVFRGVMREQTYNNIVARRHAKKVEAGTKNLTRVSPEVALASWESAIFSAQETRRILRRHAPATPEEQEWADTAMELVRAALREMHSRKKKELLSLEGRVMWYDAVKDGRTKLRQLIDNYPAGQTDCPLQLF